MRVCLPSLIAPLAIVDRDMIKMSAITASKRNIQSFRALNKKKIKFKDPTVKRFIASRLIVTMITTLRGGEKNIYLLLERNKDWRKKNARKKKRNSAHRNHHYKSNYQIKIVK